MHERKMKDNYDREVFAIKLEQFIKNYQPKQWREPIKEVDFVPYFTFQEIDQIFSGEIPEGITKCYIKEAIQEFVKTLTKSI